MKLYVGYSQNPYSLMQVVLTQPTQLFMIIDDFISRLGGLFGLNVDI